MAGAGLCSLQPAACSLPELSSELPHTGEDSPDKLAEDVETQPLTFLVPKLLTFFSHANVHIRTYSVGCTQQPAAKVGPSRPRPGWHMGRAEDSGEGGGRGRGGGGAGCQSKGGR